MIVRWSKLLHNEHITPGVLWVLLCSGDTAAERAEWQDSLCKVPTPLPLPGAPAVETQFNLTHNAFCWSGSSFPQNTRKVVKVKTNHCWLWRRWDKIRVADTLYFQRFPPASS